MYIYILIIGHFKIFRHVFLSVKVRSWVLEEPATTWSQLWMAAFSSCLGRSPWICYQKGAWKLQHWETATKEIERTACWWTSVSWVAAWLVFLWTLGPGLCDSLRVESFVECLYLPWGTKIAILATFFVGSFFLVLRYASGWEWSTVTIIYTRCTPYTVKYCQINL